MGLGPARGAVGRRRVAAAALRRAVLLPALLAGSAAAQPAAPASLAPVTVTVQQGGAMAAFDAPASVDVIPGERLREGQLGINLSESLARVPGVTALNRQNYAQDVQISSRGYGARSTFGVRGLRRYTDGIPATAPDGQSQVSHFDLLSAGRIEVLRGPFSALYGNSSGGVISLFTADGGPDTVASVGTAFGSDGTRRANTALSGQSGRLRYTLNATAFETGGWREHSAAQRRGFNGKLRHEAGEGTRLTLVLNQVDMPGVQDPLGLTLAELRADPRQAPLARQFDTRKSVEQLQGGAILEHRLDAANTVKLTAWRGQRSTEQFQSIPPVNQGINSSGGVIDLARTYGGLDAQWVHRTRAFGAPLTLTAGATGDRRAQRRGGWQKFLGREAAPTAVGGTGARRRDEDNTVRSFDEYLQGTWTAERWSVTAGVRRSRVSFASADRFLEGSNGDDSGSARFGATTPVLGVVFHATDALNLYASLGRGFETPTFNELSYRPSGTAGLNFDLRPARSRQWEAGAKARLPAGWTANAALFAATTTDEIVVFSNNGGRSTFQNAGRTERQGLEASIAGDLGAGFSAALAATWLDARYATGFLACVAAGCAPAARQAVAAGNRIPGIPAQSLFAELAWKDAPSGFTAALELRRTGRLQANDLNDESAAGWTTAHLRLGLARTAGPWTWSGFLRVDNVADRSYVGSVIVNEGNRRYHEPAPGRTWLAGVNGAYRF